MTLNNIEISIECLETLEKSLSLEIQTNFGSTLTSRDQEKLRSCVAGLQGTACKFRQLSEFGHEQLKASAIKPRIKPWIDRFLSLNYNIDEVQSNKKSCKILTVNNRSNDTQEEFNYYEVHDPFIQELTRHLDGFMGGFKDALTQNNYQGLIGTLTSEVAQRLEKVIFKTNFSRVSRKS